eukprot:gene5145-6256_t
MDPPSEVRTWTKYLKGHVIDSCHSGEGQDNAEVSESEAAAEAKLRSRLSAEVYGIPSAEWLKLQTPARYLGNERGAVHKPWDSATVRFALTYPEGRVMGVQIYEVGASNLGHIVLYTVLNKRDGLLCDRSYMPAPDMQALLEKLGSALRLLTAVAAQALLEKHQKPLFAVESKRSLADFDTLGFSLAYELGTTNILQMLHLSGIPVERTEREEPEDTPWDVENGSSPLIFAGGPTATSNPEPFSDFFDFIALGDGEDLLPEIGECLKQCKKDRLNRTETLARLGSEVAGVYVPQFYDLAPGFGGAVFPIREGMPGRIRRRVAFPDPFNQIGLVPYVSTVHDRLTIEIRRGCTRGCRFCQPGMLTRPARDVDPDKVVEAVEQGMRSTGYNEFSLLSLSCSDYLALPAVGLEIKNRLKGENVSLSLPSQRVDRFDESIANIISGGARKSGLTFAPEAGTQRMRDIINKGLTNEELLRGIKTAWDMGWYQVKLYFMIGLPGETDADVVGIVETVNWLQQECRRGRKHLQVSLTVSNFTPKPHTPFQWHTVSSAEFDRKHELLRAAFKAANLYGVKFNITPQKISAMEAQDGEDGCMARRWYNTDEAHAAWGRAIAECGLDWKYREMEDGEWNVLEKLGDTRYRKQGGGGKGRIDRGALADERLKAPLPWDHINTGISKTWLATDLQKALEEATVPDCAHSGLCSECGVCGDDFGDNVVAEVPQIPAFKGHYEPDHRRTQRMRVRFGKHDTMVYIGHLDLVHVFERALRRAAIPLTTKMLEKASGGEWVFEVSQDNSPYHSRPRINVAMPLSLGATSDSEILEVSACLRATAARAGELGRALIPCVGSRAVDFEEMMAKFSANALAAKEVVIEKVSKKKKKLRVELTEKMPVAEFKERLAEQLPSDLPLFDVEALEAIRLNGAVAESAAALLSGIEWYIAVTVTPSASVVAAPAEEVSQEEVDRVDAEASQQDSSSAPAIPGLVPYSPDAGPPDRA